MPELRPVAENEWLNLLTGEVLDDAQAAKIRGLQVLAAQKHGQIDRPLDGWSKERPVPDQAESQTSASLPMAPPSVTGGGSIPGGAAERADDTRRVPDEEKTPEPRPSRSVEEAPRPRPAPVSADKAGMAHGAPEPQRPTNGDSKTVIEKLDRLLAIAQGLERSWRAQTADMDRWKRSLKTRGRILVIASRAGFLAGGLIVGAGTQYMLGSWIGGDDAVADRIERYGENIEACEERLKGYGPGHFCGVTVFRQQ